MASEVWYRKWRPQSFADVAGQRHVTVTLARAVVQGRVAHAYLFCGPRGTGKTSTARILAKAVNCESNQDGQPCNACESCIAVGEGRALDLIEMDAASNRGIDEIRSLRDRVNFSPTSSRYKVYLIDEVHELTQFAFDALLKTLEEPPPHVIFILATTEAHKVPETILSRCQRFDFVRIKLVDVVERLRQICEGERITAEDAALEVIARRATGSLRDGVNLLEQTVNSQGPVLTEERARTATGTSGDARAAALAKQVLARDLAGALTTIAAVRDDGIELRQFTRDVVQYVRSLLLVRAGAAESLNLGADALQEMQAAAGEFAVQRLLQVAQALTRVDFRADPQSPLPLELAVVECIELSASQAAEQPAATAVATAPPARQSAGAAPGSPSDTAQRLRERLAPRTAPPPPLRIESAPAAVANSGAQSRGVSAPPVVPAPSAATNGTAGTPQTAPAQSPAPAEPGVAQPAGEVLSLDTARRRFREVWERCKEIDRRAAPALNSPCDIVEIGPGTLVIGMKQPTPLKMAVNGIAAIQQAVDRVYGPGYTVRIVQDDGVINRIEALGAERPSHLLDEALKLGARPLQPG